MPRDDFPKPVIEALAKRVGLLTPRLGVSRTDEPRTHLSQDENLSAAVELNQPTLKHDRECA